VSTIGVFDSGVGGLSVLRAIRQLMPAADLIYAGDSAYAPYGDRADEYIVNRSVAIAGFLVEQGIDALVVACNTATAVAISDLRARLTIPVIGIEPGVKPAAALSKSGVVGVLATTRTVDAPKFRALLDNQPASTRFIAAACPGLVERIESGDLDGPATRALVRGYLDPLIAAGADVIVLGCTHYPFATAMIQEVAGGVALVDPALAVARHVERRLEEAGVTPANSGTGKTKFFTSGNPTAAAPLFERLWGEPVVLQPLPLPGD
jgi:glutamate racemase